MGESERVSNQMDEPTTWYGKTINLSLRILMAFLGIAILSMGATLLRTNPILGLDPFTAFNMGLSNDFHIPLGFQMLGMNLFIFIFIFFLDRKKIGIGTIMNMVLVGFEIQWFTVIYNHFMPPANNIPMIIINLVAGLLLFTAGSSIYMAPDLGVAPYDAIAPIASARLHCKYKTARVTQDICFLIAAVIARGPVGIASIVVAFFAGPLISFWDNHVSTPIVNYISDLSDKPSLKQATQGISKAALSGYHYLTHAYNSTLTTQMNLSGYSNKQLSQRLHDAETNMHDSQKAYNAYRTQYRMLMLELVKRQHASHTDPNPASTGVSDNKQQNK